MGLSSSRAHSPTATTVISLLGVVLSAMVSSLISGHVVDDSHLSFKSLASSAASITVRLDSSSTSFEKSTIATYYAIAPRIAFLWPGDTGALNMASGQSHMGVPQRVSDARRKICLNWVDFGILRRHSGWV
jgi:hypothetical protein